MQFIPTIFVVFLVALSTECSVFESNVETGGLIEALRENPAKLLETEAGVEPLAAESPWRIAGLFFVGSVNRKYFYIEREFKNWTSAKALCEERGMKLARVETEEEKTFVYTKIPSSDRIVWLGAKERYTLEWPKIYWDGTDVAVSPQISWFYEVFSENALVIDVDISSGNKNKFGIYPQRSLFYTLCSMVV